MAYVSAVNQPDLVSLSSNDDAAPANFAPPLNWVEARVGFFDKFRIDLETPILSAKSSLLTVAAIPSTALNIPDYQMAFGFYKVPIVGSQPEAGGFSNPAYFHYMIGTSSISPDAQATGPPYASSIKNQPFANYTAFTAWLNELRLFNAVFLADLALTDISFYYDSSQQKIYIEIGTPLIGPNYAYQLALPNDPNMVAAVANYKANILPGGAPEVNARYSLATRVGFAYNAMVPTFLGGICVSSGGQLWPNASPNLVYSNTMNLRSSIVQGSSVSSNNDHDVLAVVPLTAPPLGITLYQNKTGYPQRRTANSIYQIDIQMTDDNDEPYYLPDSCNVVLEMYFLYQ
jgi:hypothetical protein